ncbi:MAG TPA: PHP domain-containing protein [Longimicrobiales bacterium]
MLLSMKVDLHLHTTASDGSLSPSAVVWAARAGGLDVIAITDHDTCAGVQEAMAALPGAMQVIPGVELSTTLDGCEIHILGYFVDPSNERLLAHAAHAVDARRVRVERMLDLLRKYSIHVTLDDVLASAEGSVRVLGRPHVARALQKKGYVQTHAEAFDRFLGDSGPCFLPTELLSPQAAIEIIKQAGGVALWAHPRSDALERELPRMLQWGLTGLECYRPRASPEDLAAIHSQSARHDLLLSGGSDWHGSWHGRLGDFYVEGSDVARLLEVGGI